MALGERLSYLLDLQGGSQVVGELQRVGSAGAESQNRIQREAARTDAALAATGSAGTRMGATVAAGGRDAQTALGRMSDRLGITESTLRTGIATAATVGFGVLIAKGKEAVDQYIDLAGEVRNFQRASGASAEESSRFVAVLDDLQISAEAGTTAVGKLARADPEKLAAFGIEVARLDDGTVSLTETLLNAADAYAATEDPQQRALLANAAFGRSYQTLIPLLEQGRAGLRDYFAGVNEGQLYTQQALDQAREYELALDGLQDAAADFGQVFGREVVPGITSLLTSSTGVLSFIQSIPGPLAEAGISAAGFALAGVGVNRVLSMMSSQTSGVGRLATSLSSFGRFGIVGASIGVAIPLIGMLTDQVRSLLVTDRDVNRLTTSLQALGTTGSAGGAFADMGGIEGAAETLRKLNEVGKIGDSSFLDDLSNFAAPDLSQGTEDIEALDAALAQIASSGNAEAAQDAYNQLAAAAEAQGVPLDALQDAFPQYAAAMEDAGLAAEGTADSTGALTDATAAAAEVIDYAEEAATRLTEALDAMNGKQLTLAEADIALRDSMADLADQVNRNREAGDANATSLDRNTQAGRDNESALIDQIRAAQDLADATARQTGSTEAGRQAFQNQIGSIRDNMIALGFNEDQVDGLIATYGRVPSNVSTTTVVRDQATGALQSITSSMDSLDGRVSTVTVRQRFLIARQEDVPLSVFDGTRATGGAVSSDGTYLVGERRAEVFRPAVPGTIVPTAGASSGGGGRSVTVNVRTVENAQRIARVATNALADEEFLAGAGRGG